MTARGQLELSIYALHPLHPSPLTYVQDLIEANASVDHGDAPASSRAWPSPGRSDRRATPQRPNIWGWHMDRTRRRRRRRQRGGWNGAFSPIRWPHPCETTGLRHGRLRPGLARTRLSAF